MYDQLRVVKVVRCRSDAGGVNNILLALVSLLMSIFSNLVPPRSIERV